MEGMAVGIGQGRPDRSEGTLHRLGANARPGKPGQVRAGASSRAGRGRNNGGHIIDTG